MRELEEQNVLLRIEIAKLQILVDALTRIVEEFCREEMDRRSHRSWWDENEIVKL